MNNPDNNDFWGALVGLCLIGLLIVWFVYVTGRLM
jgi:hypothetical protein